MYAYWVNFDGYPVPGTFSQYVATNFAGPTRPVTSQEFTRICPDIKIDNYIIYLQQLLLNIPK